MLTERDLALIRERQERFQTRRGRLDALLSAQDVPALLAEIERVSGQLAEAWLVLDGIAREAGGLSAMVRPYCVRLGEEIGSVGQDAARMLMRQGAPGWKK